MKSLLLMAVVLLSGQVFASECMTKSRVRSWDVKNNTTVVFRENSKKSWEVKTVTCPDLKWAEAIAFETRPRNTTWVCQGDAIIALDGFGRRRSNFPCTIRSIKRIP